MENSSNTNIEKNKHKRINIFLFFTSLEAECPAACRGDECHQFLANAGFNAPRELLTGFTETNSNY